MGIRWPRSSTATEAHLALGAARLLLIGASGSMTSMRVAELHRARRMSRACASGSAIVAALLLASPFAAAQGSAATPAQRLFDEGRVLEARGLRDEACTKFAESEALEPAVGTLLNLATCADRRGATATAWHRYRDAALLCARNGDAAREADARRSASEIEKRLSRLALTPPSNGLPNGAVIRRDGDVVSVRDLGTPVPVDPGPHVVAIAAPGYASWSTRVDVGAGPLVVAVALPALQATNAADAPARANDPTLVARESPMPNPPPESRESGASRDSPATGDASVRRAGLGRTMAYVVGGIGIAAVGVGAYYALRARSVWSDVTARCPDARCPDAASAAELAPRQAEASRDGTAATIALVSGALAIGAGALLYVLSNAPSSPAARARTSGARWSVAGDVGPGGGAMLATVRFE